jgi:hypothetical protein
MKIKFNLAKTNVCFQVYDIAENYKTTYQADCMISLIVNRSLGMGFRMPLISN